MTVAAPPVAEPTDLELVEWCKRGLSHDTRPFEMIMTRYKDRVFAIAYRMLGDTEDAQDVAQDVFIKIYNGLRSFSGDSALSTWIYRIATNACLDAIDKRKRRPQAARPIAMPDEDEQAALDRTMAAQGAVSAAAEDVVMERELHNCIAKTLSDLDKNTALLITMRDVEDMAYEEIAAALNIGLSAVKMRIHRARLSFQERFRDFCKGFAAYAERAEAKQRGKGAKP